MLMCKLCKPWLSKDLFSHTFPVTENHFKSSCQIKSKMILHRFDFAGDCVYFTDASHKHFSVLMIFSGS